MVSSLSCYFRIVILLPLSLDLEVTGFAGPTLTGTAVLISELTRFDSFYIFSTELLVL